MTVSLKDITEARSKIKDVAVQTPLGFSKSASDILGCEVYLKHENEQRTGSFKIRGSLNKMLSLSKEEKLRGVVASSAGNHAQGVAFSAGYVGTKATIVMPETAPLVKVLATRDYGAEVISKGRVYDESYNYAKELEKKEGYIFVHPYDDDKVIAGQGTIGLELLEAIPDLDSIVIPVGGGGLISGVATAAKAINPKVKIYGAVSDSAPGLMQLFNGQPLNIPETGPSIADGISVKKPSQRMLETYIKKLVDGMESVSDNEIAESIVFFLERAKTVTEGSAAAVLAAAQKAKWDLGKKTALLLSGGNIDLNTISKVIERGLMQKGRLARIETIVADRPGTLNHLTEIIANHEANIIEVTHDRVRSGLALSETAINFLVETKSTDHCLKIIEAIKAAGVKKVSLYGGE